MQSSTKHQAAIINQEKQTPALWVEAELTLTSLSVRPSLLPAPSTGHACEMMEREDGKKRRWALRSGLPDCKSTCPGCIHNSPECSFWVPTTRW